MMDKKLRFSIVCLTLSLLLTLGAVNVAWASITQTYQAEVQKLLPTGAQLVKPQSPKSAGAIQGVDLDQDGQNELLVTYEFGQNKKNSGLMILKEQQGQWKKILEKNSRGQKIDWAGFADLDGNRKPEVLVGWKIGASAGSYLDILSWKDNSLFTMAQLGYHQMEVLDSPNKNGVVLALWQKDTGDAYKVNLLRWDAQVNSFVDALDAYPEYFKKVIVYYQEKIRQVPKTAFYWYYLADAQTKAGIPEKALKSIEKGIALKGNYPSSSQWQTLKGETLNKLTKYKEARNSFQKAIATIKREEPNNKTGLVYAYLGLGESYLGLQQNNFAKIAFQIALNNASHLGRSKEYFLLNDYLKRFQPTKNTQALQNFGKVILYVQQADDGIPLSWSLVVDGYEKVRLGNEDGLYSYARIDFLDVDGDKKEEILFYRYNSGTAGTIGLDIYKTTGGQWRKIFTLTNLDHVQDKQFKVKYLGNYQASFLDRKTGLQSIIPLDKKNYQGIENLLKTISTWVDPVSAYQIADEDSDGIREIVTVQRVIGISHPDTIAVLKTTYKLQKGYYKAVTSSLLDSQDHLLQQIKL